MIQPTAQDAGRRVVYVPHPGAAPELGRIILLNDAGEPFVMFDNSPQPKLTPSARLSWVEEDPATLYLVRKRNGGPYWRPDRCGYTTSKALAGRYSLPEARACVSMTSEMLPEADGPDSTSEEWVKPNP